MMMFAFPNIVPLPVAGATPLTTLISAVASLPTVLMMFGAR